MQPQPPHSILQIGNQGGSTDQISCFEHVELLVQYQPYPADQFLLFHFCFFMYHFLKMFKSILPIGGWG